MNERELSDRIAGLEEKVDDLSASHLKILELMQSAWSEAQPALAQLAGSPLAKMLGVRMQ